MRSFLRSWLPVIVWALLISMFSTDEFSSSNTSRIIDPLVLWIFPNASSQLQEAIHYFVRKLGHWSEYFVLSWLLVRGFQGEPRRKLQVRWIVWTLALVLVYALIDELHQAFVPSRSARLADSMLNFFGGVSAVGWKYLHQPKNGKSLDKDEKAS